MSTSDPATRLILVYPAGPGCRIIVEIRTLSCGQHCITITADDGSGRPRRSRELSAGRADRNITALADAVRQAIENAGLKPQR
jgi:hypothetical protein